jgi:aspartate kinase
MKFGGTSVADQAAIERLISIVRAQRQADAQQEGGDARGPIVVVSALAKVTDRLLGVAANAGAGDLEGARTNLRELRQRHITVSKVITDAVQREQVVAFIDREFDELERIAQALCVLQEVSPRWLDAIAATGEILSSRIVAAALTAHGLLATWIDARRTVVTDGEFTSAAPLFDDTTASLMTNVDPPLAAGRVPVMGGFVGATRDGITTTLGRGGSDYSAAIIGACLGAGEIQIWTDVDGMLTADPRIVADPYVVPHLSFAEASELAYFGAKVLHPATIQPAVSRNIPVRILNSHRPHARGTLITGSRPPSERPLTAIASKQGVTVVSISSTRMLMAHGFLRRLFEVFERWKTPVDVVTTSEVTVSVTIDDRRRLPSIVEALSQFADVEAEHDMAIVCVVGEALQTDPQLIGRVLQGVGDIPIRLVSQAASRSNVTFVIRQGDLPQALGRLHAKFFAPVAAPAGLA